MRRDASWGPSHPRDRERSDPPIIIVLTLPITIFTLGLFLLVINAAMLGLVASLFNGFRVAGFGSAILGSVVVSITG